MPDPDLDTAYRATDYRVDGPNRSFMIRIGDCSVDLDELLFDERESNWAYLTACNPGSARLTDEANARRTDELRTVLRAGWPRHYPGVSVGRDGTWREPSFLVLGITESDAVELARHFGQNAIVAGRVGEPARLVWVAES
jgi:hypothetical protein